VLDDGKVVESGTHEELLANNSQYSKLWNVQTGKR
jgi:ABC-type multidrug transport system fused ATPase/permease subunit